MPFFSNEIRPLIPLYGTMLLEGVGSGLVASILNVVARDDLGCSNMQVGIVWSSYNAALILGSLVMGYFSDIVRRKYVLIVTLFWVGCGYILTAFSASYQWFLVSRIVTGLCGGSFPIAASILSANLSGEFLPFGIGRLATVSSLGFAIGPLISSAITAIWNVDSSSPFYIQRMYFFVAAGVYAVAALSASRLRASLTAPSRTIPSDSQRSGGHDGCITKGLCLIWSSRYFSTSAVTAIYVTQVYMWREYLELNRIQISLMTMASGLVVSIGQGFGFPYLVKRIGFHQALLSGISCIAIACVAIGPVTVYTRSVGVHVVCLVVFWLGIACMEPGTVVAVSRHLRQSKIYLEARWPIHTGFAMGITSAMKYAASLSIPTLAGLLYDNHRELVYYVGAAICSLGIIAVVSAWRLYESKSTPVSPNGKQEEETTNSVYDDTTVDGP